MSSCAFALNQYDLTYLMSGKRHAILNCGYKITKIFSYTVRAEGRRLLIDNVNTKKAKETIDSKVETAYSNNDVLLLRLPLQ